jgi:hypothetical protein
MPSVTDESDLIPTDESDLIPNAPDVPDTPAARLARIKATPLPETSGSTSLRSKLRTATGIGLPVIGDIAAGPVGGAAGSAAAEGLDKLISPPEEAPTLLGSASRIGAQAAAPFVMSKVAGKLAPLAEKLPSLIPKSVLESEAAGILRGVVHKATLFKNLTTPEKEIVDGIVNETSHYSPLIDAKDLLATLKEGAKRAGFRAEKYGQVVDAVKVAASEGNGSVALPEVHAILRQFRASVTSQSERKAVDLISGDLLDTMEQHIAENHPLKAQAAAQFRNLSNMIGTKLGIAEDAMRLAKVNPLQAIRNIAQNPDSKGVIQALDWMTGSSFMPQIEAHASKIIEQGTKAGSAVALKAAQEEARKTLTNLMVAAGAGTGRLVNAIGAMFLGRNLGATGEAAMALGARTAAKVAPAATAAAGKGVEALFGPTKPAPDNPLLAEAPDANR